jgi:hypothetical protein
MNIKPLCLVLVLLSGCSTGTLRYDVKKTGVVSIDNVQSIIDNYRKYGINKNTVLQTFNLYPSVNLKSIYKIGFPFSLSETVQDSENATYHKRVENISIGLCNQRRNSSNYTALGKNGSYQVYVSLKELRERGLVANNIKNQKEICIYRDYTAPTHAVPMGHFEVKSNRVKYGVNEINRAVSLLQKIPQ